MVAFCFAPNCWFSWLKHGWNKWYVWLILFIALAFWIWRIDKDMKENGGTGLFENLFSSEE